MTTGRINQVAAEKFVIRVRSLPKRRSDSDSQNFADSAYVGWIFECVLA